MKTNLKSLIGVVLFLLTLLPAHAFYNSTTGRWLSRDPVNEAGFSVVMNENPKFHESEEFNLYSFVGCDPIAKYDVNGLAGPVIPATAAIAVAMVLCAGPDFLIAKSRYADAGDGFLHCWVSCRISKKCGGWIAQLAGLTKEARDEVVKQIEKTLNTDIDGSGGIGDDPGFDIRDILDNQPCIGLQTYFPLPAVNWAISLCRESCEDCCRRKVGYYKVND